jgi:hypothetical protein
MLLNLTQKQHKKNPYSIISMHVVSLDMQIGRVFNLLWFFPQIQCLICQDGQNLTEPFFTLEYTSNDWA